MPPLACGVPDSGVHPARHEPVYQGSRGADGSATPAVASRHLYDSHSRIPPSYSIRHGGSYASVGTFHGQPVLARRCGVHGRDSGACCFEDAIGDATLWGFARSVRNCVQSGTGDVEDVQCSLSSAQVGPTMGRVPALRRGLTPGGEGGGAAITAELVEPGRRMHRGGEWILPCSSLLVLSRNPVPD
jgi:hypothetical protein